MWSLIFFIGACSALSVKEDHEHVSTKRIPFGYNINAVFVEEKILTQVFPMTPTFGSGRIINLSGSNIKAFRNHVFDDLDNVTDLDLSNNELENIPPFIFTTLETLQTLSLANNKLRTFDRCFVGLRNLKSLDLSNNLIEFLTTGDLLGLPKSVNLITAGNPLKKVVINFGDPSLPYYVPSELNQNPWNGLDMSDLEPIVQMWEDLMNVPINSSYGLAWRSYNSSQFNIKLCKTNDGVVESLNVAEVGEALGDCQMMIPKGLSLTLNLENLEIKQFEPTWYLITKNLFETLSLSSNKIINMSPTLLENLPDSIISVKLEHNRIGRIEKNNIRNAFLKKISFEFNQIEKIEDGAFAETNLVPISFAYNNLKDNLNFTETLPKSIQELILAGNSISNIPENFVKKLTALEHLVLENNYISHLSANTFRGLKKLRIINLSINWLEDIEPGTFEDQKELLMLDLFYNKIKKITPGIFRGLKMLRSLSLQKNLIGKISNDSFSELRDLIMSFINLSQNKIDTIEEGSFSRMTIRRLDISANHISKKSVAKRAFELCTLNELFYDSNPLKNINGHAFNSLLLYKENRFPF